MTQAFNTQLPKVSTGKSPTSNILLRMRTQETMQLRAEMGDRLAQ